MKIVSCISELLHLYDCVVVPGFGGFVCNFEPARIHPVQHRFSPPSKRISFNPLLQVNDGLLAHLVSRKFGLTYEEAVAKITNEVRSWNEELKQKKSLQLDDVGSFKMDAHGKLIFEEEDSVNYLRDSYGLTVFQSLPVKKEQKLRVVHQKEEVDKEEVAPAINWSRIANYSSAAALISLLTLTTFKLDLVDRSKLNQISLNPFKKEMPKYREMQVSSSEDLSFSGNSDFENSISAAGTSHLEYDLLGKKITVILDEKDPEDHVEAIEIPKPFHVVAGCFSVEGNANRLHKKIAAQRLRSQPAGFTQRLARSELPEFFNAERGEQNARQSAGRRQFPGMGFKKVIPSFAYPFKS